MAQNWKQPIKIHHGENRQSVVYLCHGILPSHKKEWDINYWVINITKANTIHRATWLNLDIMLGEKKVKHKISTDFLYMKF